MNQATTSKHPISCVSVTANDGAQSEQSLRDFQDTEKLTPLLRLKYNNAISDAMADWGGAARIRTMFAGFQKYLCRGRGATAAG